MKRLPTVVAGFLFLSSVGIAQMTTVSSSPSTLNETGARSELFVEGSGLFTKNVDANGLTQQASHSGGGSAGYRFHASSWNAVEVRYGYTRDTQRYFAGGNAQALQSNVHEITSAYVLTVPNLGRIQPFVSGGGGALVFDPTGNAGGSIAGAQRQTKGTFIYGGGADLAVLPRVSLRAEYRGLVYKAPDFQLSSLHTDRWTHTAVPLVGVVVHF
jgi:opacity protein-like surface antigen